MLPALIVPETVARQDGAGAAVALESSSRSVLLTLGITRVLEYESLELSIAGSADGAVWRKLAEFPPESYCGQYRKCLDLSPTPDVRYLRAEWKVERWNSTKVPPLFEFSVRAVATAAA